ncbi:MULTISPECIES: DNA-binding protein [unclassified Neptuniibacter]|jgi:chromosome segregation ATPase|uniref:DNA-binding protein n=1 Tax=unclassified Neptuniibacter TaxID=2630693 RepID=UPI0026E17ADA|nr:MULTISPECIES: DNA-binding protein [unclassified Neptuniibacter]MDO6515502.1 hypothetical protein [Neptuniibacter sp. 2_MG-2023]MDO6595197.1 hypothetical protein [Neptuniibacter sp. 1_MG-2023]
MSDLALKEKIYSTADRLLLAGFQPTALLISESLGCDEAIVETDLHEWWALVPERIVLNVTDVSVPEIPESLTQSFSKLWQQAVQEANGLLSVDKHSHDAGLEVVRREADESLKESRGRLSDIEERLRAEINKKEDAETQIKALEAEIEVLKANLMAETSQRKQEEQSRLNVEQELNHLRKTYDDSKRTFDLRIKEEQRHTLEAVSKADADVRYYRGALEKLRDEVGKKESALTKNIHDLQAELARKDVKNDTQKTQIKSLEAELKQIKQDTSGQTRELSKINSSLLAESNKNKRLEDKVKVMDEEVRRARQKQVSLASEHSRREASIRSQFKDKEDELVRSLAKINSLEKKIIAQDEEIRRLNARG